jgi:hypothetical protein
MKILGQHAGESRSPDECKCCQALPEKSNYQALTVMFLLIKD